MRLAKKPNPGVLPAENVVAFDAAKRCRFSKHYEPPPDRPVSPETRRRIAEGLASLSAKLSASQDKNFSRNFRELIESPEARLARVSAEYRKTPVTLSPRALATLGISRDDGAT